MSITDTAGRNGIAYTTPHHPGIVWARPDHNGAMEGSVMRDTPWQIQPDGTLEGLWYDSPMDAKLKAVITP